MKMRNVIILSSLLSVLAVMCGKKNSTNPENKPPACDMSGSWTILATVTGGNQYPSGTEFTAVLSVSQTEDGNASGSTTTEGGLTGELTGTLSDLTFSFKIKQNLPCIGTFKGTGTITDNNTRLSGNYSGSDCHGTLQASFYSIKYTPQDSGGVTDIDGNIYQTVRIGNQVWMTENLRVTHYRNGDGILHVANAADRWYYTTGAFCAYDDDEINAIIYGNLYNWYAVNDSRNIAPEGWHVPKDDDWKELEVYLGLNRSEADTIGFRGTNEGGKLKETGIVHWKNPNIGATNETGFTALPAGSIDPSGRFSGLGIIAFFWSESEEGNDSARIRYIASLFSTLGRGYDFKGNGFSVRLIHD